MTENQNMGTDVKQEETTPQEHVHEVVPAPVKSKKKKRKKWPIVLGVIAAILVAGFLFVRNAINTATAMLAPTYSTAQVERKDITKLLTGSGSLEPADSYVVTTLIEGEVLSDTFEEGDIVEKDDLLYVVDSSDVETSIDRAAINVKQSQTSYDRLVESLDDLNVKATESGTVMEIHVEAGDEVMVNQLLATIRNSKVMSVTLPFAEDDAENFYVGQSAAVTIEGSFETLSGTVSKIAGTTETLTGNMIVRQITIDVENPGGMQSGQSATAMVGDFACNGSGVFEYKGEATINAKVAGEVASILAKEGQFVNKNAILMRLKSNTLTDQIEKAENTLDDAKLELDNRKDQMENYNIQSPIKGTIIEKNFKTGDKLSTGKTLCTIYDMSYLNMTINVDELDISLVELGQKVKVTAGAVEGKTYEGSVTKVNIKGMTANGVTSYPVTIRIDQTEGLLPGMNVDAEIEISSVANVLVVPVSAVTRGNQVLLQTDPAADQSKTAVGGTPAGFEYVTVTTGISDENYIEVLSGLNEGDTVALVRVFTNNNMFFMPGMGAPVRAGATAEVRTTRVGG